jgi:ATP synthase protein I
MSENKDTNNESSLSREIGQKAARKIKARNSTQGVWFGLGMMGLVGWSVVVPTLLGAALGIWMDGKHLGKYSWTLMFLLMGLMIGCLNAWYWVAKEDKEINES